MEKYQLQVINTDYFETKSFAFFLEIPRNRWVYFLSLHVWKTSHVRFPEITLLFCSKTLKSLISPFSESEWGMLRKNHLINFKMRKGRNWMCSILGHFKETCKCSHVINISFTSFLRPFVVMPAVFVLPLMVIGRYGFELNSADMVNRGQPRLIMITNMTKNT